MNFTLFLAILLFWSQELDAEETTGAVKVPRYGLISYKYNRHERSLVDIWNNIKNTANHAWEFVKDTANNTKKKMEEWIKKIKIKAKDLSEEFKEKMKKIKEHIHDIIDHVMDTGEVVKICLKERKQEIDRLLKNILLDVTECLANSITYLNTLLAIQYEGVPNKTEFLSEIQDKLNSCLQKYEANNVEECVRNVKKGIYEDMESTEEYILQKHIETRSTSDDLLDTIISCTTNGLIKASSAIANETICILECVSQA